MLRRARWFVIFATLAMVVSVGWIATGQLLQAIYAAVVAVLLLVAEQVNRG